MDMMPETSEMETSDHLSTSESQQQNNKVDVSKTLQRIHIHRFTYTEPERKGFFSEAAPEAASCEPIITINQDKTLQDTFP